MRRVSECPACGGGELIDVVRADEEQRQKFVRYSRLKYGGILDDWLSDIELVVVRCAECSHHWYRDQPDESQLFAMYDASRSFFGDVVVDREPNARMRAEMRALGRLFDDHHEPALLDYGSGFGRWAKAARDEGFQVWAYEPSKVRGGTDTSAFRLVHRLEDLGSRTFAAINLEQVLEHVPAPIDVLAGIRQFCAEGAVVRIAVPNLLRCHEGSDLWRDWPFNGQCVHTMAPFEHLHGFTPRSLESLVRRAGFRMLTARRLARSHTKLVARRFVGRVWKRFEPTLVLVQKSPSDSGNAPRVV